jgi:hypothetical protein
MTVARSRPPARDDEIDGLYDVPLSDFVRRRNEIADRLRAAGKRDAAEAVRAIAKPKVTVRGINKVARRDRAAISAMLAAFDRLKQAQLRRPDEIAAAADALRAAIEAVVHKVMDAIRESGAAVSVDTHRRVATTLRGAAATERDRLRAGELTAELSAPGFELFGGAGDVSGP